MSTNGVWNDYDKYSNELIEKKWTAWDRAVRDAMEGTEGLSTALAKFDLKVSLTRTVVIDLNSFMQRDKNSGVRNSHLICRLPSINALPSKRASGDDASKRDDDKNERGISVPPLLRSKSSGPEWSREAQFGCRLVVFLKKGDLRMAKVYKIPRPKSSEDAAATRSLDLEHFSKSAFQFCNLTDKPPSSVLMVDVYVDNHFVEEQFYDTRRRFREKYDEKGRECWVFHGTRSENIAKIMVEGFGVGGEDVGVKNGSAYGKGVYTATGPTTPITYARDCRCIILARALEGKHSPTKRHPNPKETLQTCDSWSPVKHWMVFRKGCQLLPRYVVYYK